MSGPFEHVERGNADYFQGVELDVIENSRDEKYGETVLTMAARDGKLSCCQVIYRRCPQFLYAISGSGNTALHNAAYNGRNEVVKFLLTAKATMEQEAKGIKSEGVAEDFDHKLLMMVSNYGDTALHSATRKSHFQSAKLLVLADPSNKLLALKTSSEDTALHIAVENHDLDIVELLVQAAPDFEYSANIHGKTPLFMAWEEALSEEANTDIRKLLIRKQPAQCGIPTGENNWTLIHHATQKGDISTVKEIIRYCPDICEMVDKKGHNFLHLAVKFDQLDVLEYILELRRHITDNVLNRKDNYGNTPLHLATTSANQSIALALLDDHRVNKMIENKQGKKALDMVSSELLGALINDMYPIRCASKGDVDFFTAIHVDVLRESKDEDGESVLSIAASKGHLNCCEVISKKCPELLYHTKKNKITILHTAASNGKDDIVKFFIRPQHKMNLQGVENVKSGGEEETVDYKLLMMLSDNHRTALHFAVEKGHFLSAKLLIEAIPNNKLLRSTDSHKETAMHYAVKKHYLEIVKLLVEADPDYDYSTNDSGHTPLFIALQEALSGDPIAVEIRKFLIQKQPKQCKVRIGSNGWTILQHATFKGDLSAVEEIIQFCPDCSELIDNEKRNFLHLAIRYEHENIIKLILDLPSVSDNVLNGQDINGDTPLHNATSKGNERMILPLLYNRRVTKKAKNKQGKSALNAINFDYDKIRADVLGLLDSVDEKELKDRSDFDLLVGALISTVSFTAGITVPGGYISDGPNRGNAILYKKRTFEAFVVFNTLALALSLSAVFSHFCMKQLVNKNDIIYQLKVATFSSIAAIFAMMVAFIMGSFAVLSISLGLAITVCSICCCFFGFSFYSLWRMRKQKRQGC